MENRTLKVLLIGDDEDDFVVTRDLLDGIEDRDFRLEWISDYAAALEKVQHNEYDVCLTDYQLGEYNGLELLLAAQDRGCRQQQILLLIIILHSTTRTCQTFDTVASTKVFANKTRQALDN